MSAEQNLDADAFMRKYLERPSDTTARLVFADWLEETGEAHNAAWAHFIRLKAEADRYPSSSATRHELDRHAGVYATQIRARLTVPAKLFVGYPKSLLQLLPATNLTVRLVEFDAPPAVLNLVPEGVARENLVFPLAAQGRAILLAAADPHDAGVIEELEYFLNRDVLLVRADVGDILWAIDRHYDATDVDGAMAPLAALGGAEFAFETVPGTYPVEDAADFLDDVLGAADRRGASIITFAPHGELIRVIYTTGHASAEAGRISRADWTALVFPEVLRRGEASGVEFTVDVLRNGGDQAVRIWSWQHSHL